MKLPQIAILPDITTDGKSCYTAYNLDIQGIMSHGETIIEAYNNTLIATEEYMKFKDKPIIIKKSWRIDWEFWLLEKLRKIFKRREK